MSNDKEILIRSETLALDRDYELRIIRLENQHGEIMTQLSLQSNTLLAQATATNRIATQIETFVKDAVDRGNGVVPKDTMLISDHKAQQKFLVVTLTTMMTFVIGAAMAMNKISSLEESKKAINTVAAIATDKIKEATEETKK